jgi:hypothetical protein
LLEADVFAIITVLLSGIIDTGLVCPRDPCRAVLALRDTEYTTATMN